MYTIFNQYSFTSMYISNFKKLLTKYEINYIYKYKNTFLVPYKIIPYKIMAKWIDHTKSI